MACRSTMRPASASAASGAVLSARRCTSAPGHGRTRGTRTLAHTHMRLHARAPAHPHLLERGRAPAAGRISPGFCAVSARATWTTTPRTSARRPARTAATPRAGPARTPARRAAPLAAAQTVRRLWSCIAPAVSVPARSCARTRARERFHVRPRAWPCARSAAAGASCWDASFTAAICCLNANVPDRTPTPQIAAPDLPQAATAGPASPSERPTTSAEPGAADLLMVRLMCVNECATRFAASEAEATAALCATLAEFWAISTAAVRVVSLSGAPAMGRLEIVVGGAQRGLLRRAHICAGTRPASAPGLGPHLRRDSAHNCAGGPRAAVQFRAGRRRRGCSTARRSMCTSSMRRGSAPPTLRPQAAAPARRRMPRLPTASALMSSS